MKAIQFNIYNLSPYYVNENVLSDAGTWVATWILEIHIMPTKKVIYEWRFESEMFKIKDCISVFFYILRTKHIGNIADAQ